MHNYIIKLINCICNYRQVVLSGQRFSSKAILFLRYQTREGARKKVKCIISSENPLHPQIMSQLLPQLCNKDTYSPLTLRKCPFVLNYSYLVSYLVILYEQQLHLIFYRISFWCIIRLHKSSNWIRPRIRSCNWFW